MVVPICFEPSPVCLEPAPLLMTACTGDRRGALLVRDGPPEESEVTGEAAVGTHMGQRKNRGLKPSSAFRPCDVTALTLRTMSLHWRTPRTHPQRLGAIFVRPPKARLFTFGHLLPVTVSPSAGAATGKEGSSAIFLFLTLGRSPQLAKDTDNTPHPLCFS